MIVRRLASRRLVKSGSTEPEPRRRRAPRVLLGVVIAGMLAFIGVWTGIWPFGNVQALLTTAFTSTRQLPAESVFPPVQPTYKTVDVYDQHQAGKEAEPGDSSEDDS